MSTVHFLECDFHTHTEYSAEAGAKGFTLARLFEVADKLGLRYVGYSEHWHQDSSPDLFLRIREEVEQLQPRHKVKVFVSAEINALNSRGDMTYDPVKAAEILDYVSVAISHHREQLKPDYVEDTLEMIDVVSRIPAVTMLMHPQIVYGHKLKHVDAVIPQAAYDQIIASVVQRGKIIDYPSVEMSERYLRRLGYSEEKLAIARKSFENFTKALVGQGARLAPGSDAHNELYHDGASRWFGNNRASWELLQAYGFEPGRLWYFENR